MAFTLYQKYLDRPTPLSWVHDLRIIQSVSELYNPDTFPSSLFHDKIISETEKLTFHTIPYLKGC
jgi:hypothetical protein